MNNMLWSCAHHELFLQFRYALCHKIGRNLRLMDSFTVWFVLKSVHTKSIKKLLTNARTEIKTIHTYVRILKLSDNGELKFEILLVVIFTGLVYSDYGQVYIAIWLRACIWLLIYIFINCEKINPTPALFVLLFLTTRTAHQTGRI